MKILFFDVETTGLDPKLHEIIQLAYILDVDGVPVLERSRFLRPLKPYNVTVDALSMQGRTMEQVLAFPHPFEAYTHFLDDLGAHIDKYDKTDKAAPCAYNAPFDVSFLLSWFEQLNDPYLGSWIDLRRLLDPMPVLRMMDSVYPSGLQDFKLATVARHFNIDLTAHDALSDVRALRGIYYRTIQGIKAP